MSTHSRSDGSYYTDSAMMDADIGAYLDAEINALVSTINALNNENIVAGAGILASKLDLSGGGYVADSGDAMTGALVHEYDSADSKNYWFAGRTTGNGRIFTGVGAGYWCVSYNTYHNGSTWQGRDKADICWRIEFASTGLKTYTAVSASQGVTPTWVEYQQSGSQWFGTVGNYTFYTPIGITKLLVTMVGGGGGGGGGGGSGAGVSGSGGGGGAGGAGLRLDRWLVSVDPSEAIPLTIGAKGTGGGGGIGAQAGANGVSGGDTVFTANVATLTSFGGYLGIGGGYNGGAGGAGGVYRGQNGGPGKATGAGDGGDGGDGGRSYQQYGALATEGLGGDGGGQYEAGSDGTAATAWQYGNGGGGGGGAGEGAGTFNGGDGEDGAVGFILVEW